MTGTPSVSVVIPCFNAAHTIGIQLEALRRQLDPPTFEVIVVDNASQDDLVGALRPYRGLSEYPLFVVDASEHQGSSYARNVGISHARSAVVMFCDADDAASRTWIRNGLLSTEAVGLWSGEVAMLPSTLFDLGIDEVHSAFDVPAPEWIAPRTMPPTPLPVLMGGNFGARRDTLLQLGGFDQAFAHHGDDNDLALRAQRAGHTIPVAESVRVGVREKPDLRSRLAIGRHSALARRQLMETHGTGELASLPPWPMDIARCIGATVLAPFRGGRVSMADILMRWSHAVGNAQGVILYRYLRRLPPPQLAEGLNDPGAPVPDSPSPE